MDTLHKLVWVKLVSRMLEVTSGFFAQSNDIHLFLVGCAEMVSHHW